jgi:hypothetical protein
MQLQSLVLLLWRLVFSWNFINGRKACEIGSKRGNCILVRVCKGLNTLPLIPIRLVGVGLLGCNTVPVFRRDLLSPSSGLRQYVPPKCYPTWRYNPEDQHRPLYRRLKNALYSGGPRSHPELGKRLSCGAVCRQMQGYGIKINYGLFRWMNLFI